MTIKTYTSHKELLPDEGKVLSNGRDWTTAVSLPLSADHSMWHDIDQPEEENPISAEDALNIITGM